MSNDYKKLTRSRTQRMLCGVCGGLGEYLNLDPTIIRIIWVLFTFSVSGWQFWFILSQPLSYRMKHNGKRQGNRVRLAEAAAVTDCSFCQYQNTLSK